MVALTHRAMVPASLAAMALLAAIATAGPVVTITFDDGRSERAEILAFHEGTLLFRDSASGREFEAPISRIKVMDYGEEAQIQPPPPPPAPGAEVEEADLATLRRIAESRRYLMLMLAVANTVRRQGTDRAIEFRNALEREMASPGLPRDRRRDLALSLVATHYGLLERTKGDALLRRTMAEYPDDPEVKRFVEALREFRLRTLRILEPRPRNTPPARAPGAPAR